MKLIFALIFATLTGAANADCRRSFNWTEGSWFWTATTVMALDHATTLDIARRPAEFREVAPFTRSVIGTHPSVAGVNQYFIARYAINAAIQCWAPEPWNKLVFQIETAAHGAAVVNNVSIGLRIRF